MKNEIKWAWQRVVRGYDDRLFWSMADYLDPMILEFVTNLRKTGVSFPTGMTVKKWNKVLDTISTGMQPEPDWRNSKEFKKYRRNRMKALVLLAYYWDSLWD